MTKRNLSLCTAVLREALTFELLHQVLSISSSVPISLLFMIDMINVLTMENFEHITSSLLSSAWRVHAQVAGSQLIHSS